MNKLSKRTLLIGVAGLAVAVGAGVAIFGEPARAAVATGAPAPEFSVQDASGQTRTLGEYSGRTVVLEWTNHGCP